MPFSKTTLILLSLCYLPIYVQADTYYSLSLDTMKITRDISEFESGESISSDLSGKSMGISFSVTTLKKKKPINYSLKYISEETSSESGNFDVQSENLAFEIGYVTRRRSNSSLSQLKIGYHYLKYSSNLAEGFEVHGAYIGYAFGYPLTSSIDFSASADFFVGKARNLDGYITGPKGDIAVTFAIDEYHRYKARVGYRIRTYGVSEDNIPESSYSDNIHGPFIGFQVVF